MHTRAVDPKVLRVWLRLVWLVPVTIGGAGGSGVGVCATGGGVSNAWACATGAIPADGGVGGGWGTGAMVCDIGAGGMASGAAEKGATRLNSFVEALD